VIPEEDAVPAGALGLDPELDEGADVAELAEVG
jgi:hypothetical protein